MRESTNFMKNGVLLRQLLNIFDEIDFSDYAERRAFNDIYETLLKGLQKNNGEFYTPRAITSSSQLADGIKEIERLQDKLIQREKELAVLEEKLKKENEEYEIKYNNEKTEKIRACNRRDEMEEELNDLREDFYHMIIGIYNSAVWRFYFWFHGEK